MFPHVPFLSLVWLQSHTVWTRELESSVEFTGLSPGQNYCAVANFSFPTFSMAASPKSAPQCVHVLSKAGDTEEHASSKMLWKLEHFPSVVCSSTFLKTVVWVHSGEIVTPSQCGVESLTFRRSLSVVLQIETFFQMIKMENSRVTPEISDERTFRGGGVVWFLC